MRSVALASYQGERFIGEQIDSILPQLAPEDEIVVSDDASTDATLSVVRERQSRDARIRILSNGTRLGYVANFQRAIEDCRGDHVYFSDQDDLWLPEKTKRMDEALASHACVASDATVVNESLETLYQSFFEWRGAEDFSYRSILMKPSIIGATLACQRSYLLELLPLPKGVPHDFWLTLNACWDHYLGIIPMPLILYRRHASVASETGRRSKRPLRAVLAERARILAAFCYRRAFR
jgi:glycosyltransferase involved in cell wall biosynthesis